MNNDDRLRACDLALKLAILIISIEQKRRPSARLGFTQINYGRLFVRDRWTLFAIARELGCEVREILAPPEQRSTSDSPRWPELVSAAERVLAVVTQADARTREIIRHRAGGRSWNDLARLLPGRATFSIRDDYETAITRFADDDVATLLAHDDRRLGTAASRRTKNVRRKVAKIMLSNAPVAC